MNSSIKKPPRTEAANSKKRLKTNLRKSVERNNLCGLPSLGNHARDARNLAVLLDNMQSGMSTYQKVFRALEAKYGKRFKRLYLAEVGR